MKRKSSGGRDRSKKSRFQKSRFRLFHARTLGYSRSALFYSSRRQELLPGLLIRSRMIHRAHYRGEAHRRNNANKPITSILRNRRAKGQRRGSEGVREGRGKEGFTPGGEKGRTESISCGREQPRAADTSNMQHECMRGALGNDIGIMAGHGTNEMTNGPTDWNRGLEIGAPSKEGHGVIIQANKGRSHQDYRVPRAAPHPVAPGPLPLCLRFPPVCP